jgi:hypothetical protein
MKHLTVQLHRAWGALTRHQEWNIGIVRAPISAFIDPDFVPAVEWLPAPPRGRFAADPFIFEHHGNRYILYEDFDLLSERGHIAALRLLDDGGVEPCGPVLSMESHLAYPYVFSTEGQLYCVPESARAGEVALYRIDGLPGNLESVCTLIPDFHAVDPTVFEHDGRWWLACTDQKAGPNNTLVLFHSDTLHGPWRPHAANPVKCDPGSSRPAGRPFTVDGELYRPAQDCTHTYGGRIALNRISALTPDTFREETVRWIEPDSRSLWCQGIHTINAVGSITVIDGKRERFLPRAACAAVWRNLRHAIPRPVNTRRAHA